MRKTARLDVCVFVCAAIILDKFVNNIPLSSSASTTSSEHIKTESESIEDGGGSGENGGDAEDDDGGDDEDDEGTDDTATQPKIDKGKGIMTEPLPEDEQPDYFLGPLNSNPPRHSAALDKRGSGWWLDLPSSNPRHTSLQLLPSQQTATTLHRKSLPSSAFRVVSSGSA